MPKQIIKKIYRKIFPAPVSANQITNVKKGVNTFIDPSAIIVTVDKGEILLEGNNYIGRNVEIGTTGSIKIGNNTSIQDRCILLQDIEIGKNCTFAPNVYISSGRHYYDHDPYFYIKDQDELVSTNEILAAQHSKKVTIGDDCWLGINSVVMSGIKIGRGCIIGANSVVTKDIEPFTVVAGIPAKQIKKRLEFQKKANINFENKTDLPNFYKGCLVDLKSWEKGKKLGGIITEEYFTCYLSNEGKIIELHILNDKSLKIEYNGQLKSIDIIGSNIVEFNIGNDPFHEFKIIGSNSILIKSISIKN